MKFKVTRTSTNCWWGNDNPKCEEAFQDKVIIDEGTEYERIEIDWFININTLQELIEFVNKYKGKVVIITDNHTPTIEIYDDWRE